MIDKRELILERILAVLSTFTTSTPPLVVSVARNRTLRTDEKRPGLILLDGDELVQASKHGPMGPQIMRMMPQVFILMNEQRPTNDTIGPGTNEIRVAIVNAIAGDAQLKALYGSNGSLLLNSVTTDMKSGGAVTGSMLLDFWINYPLITD